MSASSWLFPFLRSVIPGGAAVWRGNPAARLLIKSSRHFLPVRTDDELILDLAIGMQPTTVGHDWAAEVDAVIAFQPAVEVELQVVRLKDSRSRQSRHFLRFHRMHQFGRDQHDQLFLAGRDPVEGKQPADERYLAKERHPRRIR